MKNILINVLKFLDGKKTAIIGICGLIILWLSSDGYITEALAYSLQGVLTILGGGASIATKQLLPTAKK